MCGFAKFMHQSIPPAPRPPLPLLRGICTPCQSRVWGICKFCTARGPGIRQPRGHSRGFDTHAVSYQNITTQKVLLEKKQIGSSIKDRNKVKRVVKACSRFYACVPTPGNLPSKAKKMLMPGGQPGGVLGAGGIDWCITIKKCITKYKNESKMSINSFIQ